MLRLLFEHTEQLLTVLLSFSRPNCMRIFEHFCLSRLVRLQHLICSSLSWKLNAYGRESSTTSEYTQTHRQMQPDNMLYMRNIFLFPVRVFVLHALFFRVRNVFRSMVLFTRLSLGAFSFHYSRALLFHCSTPSSPSFALAGRETKAQLTCVESLR